MQINDEAGSRSRWLARFSVMAALVCCTLNCLLNRLLLSGNVSGAETWNLLVGSGTTLLVIAGAAAGGFAIMAGIQRRSFDTATIALIGLMLNLGILFVAWYALSQMR